MASIPSAILMWVLPFYKGKSHLATGLGIEMIKNGYKVKFISAAELVEELLLANEEHKLGALEKRWLKLDVIIIDELCEALHNSSYGKLIIM
jgi:DNA replication protein DnaC